MTKLIVKHSALLFCISFAFTCVTCMAKNYRILQNGTPFEDQLSQILNDIDRLSGDETIIINIESGYYSISKTIDIVVGQHKIVFLGSKSKPTTISGSIEVKDWEILQDGLWKSHVPFEINRETLPDQLYVNGVRAIRSRTPNEGAFVFSNGVTEDPLYGLVLDNKDLKSIGSVSKQDIPILSAFWRWTVFKRHLIYSSPNTDSLYFLGHNIQIEEGNGLIIENTKESIDIPGEWCVDNSGVIYYYPQKGALIEETEFRVPVVEKLIRINSKTEKTAGLCFKNIIFEHTSYSVPLDGISLGQAASRMSAAIEADNINHLVFEDCEIRNTSNYGIWLRRNCTESSIIGNYFHDIGAGAIKIGTIEQDKVDSSYLTNHVNVDNNIVYRYGMLMESAVGVILFNASDCKITHNDIYSGNYTGISLGWVWGYDNSPSKRNEVAYNRISHIGTGLLQDLAGIYTLGKSEGTHIHHNVITDIKSKNNEGWGIYADEGTSGVCIEKNVVSRTTSGGFHQHFGSRNVVSNNIFAWGETSQVKLSNVKEENPLFFSKNIIIMNTGLLMSGDSVKSKKYTIEHNCYWTVSDGYPLVADIDVNTWIQQRDSSSVFIDPCFRNAQNDDFRMKGKVVVDAIGFEKFEYSQAGVYGKRKWKNLARQGHN